jgi:hypothetical protein
MDAGAGDGANINTEGVNDARQYRMDRFVVAVDRRGLDEHAASGDSVGRCVAGFCVVGCCAFNDNRQ